jgi:GNAT superfamily N-acetyltransferase
MELSTLQGAKLLPYVDALARLRIEVFSEWPYLYQGDVDNEAEYLRAFAASPSSVLVIAREGEAVVGASSAMRLAEEAPALWRPFEQAGFDVGSWYYLAESVLLSGYRGRGFGHHFFDEREAAGRRLGFQRFAFCSVLREESDPRRPVAHRELAPFWTARGYRPSELLAVLDWREVGNTLPVSHRLRFWLKEH